jgi:hypothetical protein
MVRGPCVNPCGPGFLCMDSEQLVAELRRADLFHIMGPADLSAVAALAGDRLVTR